jgi:hypothetical protein
MHEHCSSIQIKGGNMATEANAQGAAGQGVSEQIPSDPWIYRIVVGILGLLMLIVVVGALVLTMSGGKDIPQGILALGSAAVGGLVGVLVPSPVGRTNSPNGNAN